MKGEPKILKNLLNINEMSVDKLCSSKELHEIGQFLIQKAKELEEDENITSDYRAFSQYLQSCVGNDIIESIVIDLRAKDNNFITTQRYIAEISPIFKKHDADVDPDIKKLYEGYNEMFATNIHKIVIESVDHRYNKFDIMDLGCDIIIKNSKDLPTEDLGDS